jgi:hypothetical protein
MPTKTKKKGSHSNYDKADRILREARARRMAAIKAPALRGTAAKRAAERGLFTPDPEDLPGRGLQIVAEGDSWFDYKVIIRSDILECLRDLGYRVEHDAKAGDLIDRMAHEPHQLPAVLDLIQRHKPRFMLLSGGGNDIAGAELAMLVNHRNSALAHGGEVLRKGVVDYIMDTAFKGAYQRVIDTCLDAARQANIPKFQIIGHGYDYPFADGRAVIDVGPIEIIGPWLEPPLKVRGYLSEADRNSIMRQLIDRINDVLKNLENQYGGAFHYVDLRKSLTKRSDWANELHPDYKGFQRVAKKFHMKMQNLLP